MGRDAATDVRRLQRLLEASRLLNSTLEPFELTEIVLNFLHDELPIDRCTLFVVDRRRKVLRSMVAQGLDSVEIVLAFGEGLAGSVAVTGEPLDVSNAYDDERFHPGFDQRFGFRTKDAFCLPIFNRDEALVGVLQLLNRWRSFTPDDHEFLAGMCTYIGIALHNAWLHHELKNRKAAEEELRVVQERLAQDEKESALGELTAGIVHEIRNPLAIVMGHCGLFREDPGITPAMEARIGKIENALASAVAVCENFLKFARRPAAMESVDLNSVINQTLDLLAYEFRMHAVSILLDLESVPSVNGVTGHLQQVLLNVLKNAMYAACERGEGGVVSVRSLYARTSRAVRVEICDNGPGIPDDLQSRIFEPFFTTKPSGKGTGIGLAVSKRIIEQHDGALSFVSAAGLGTTFSIELPAAHAVQRMAAGE